MTDVASCQPWLMADEKPNVSALVDLGPRVHWYKLEEARDTVDRAGVDITWAAARRMLSLPSHAR